MAPGAVSGSLEPPSAMRHISLPIKARRAVNGGMALQAQQSLLTPFEQEIVHAAVRSMARGAAFYSDNRVFINEWSALFNVALHAAFPVGLGQLEVVRCAVRIVAVRAFHEALTHSVMFRQGKLRLNCAMATKTKFGLWRLQQPIRQPGILLFQPWNGEELRLGRLKFGLPCIRDLNRMDGMAIDAADASSGVN